MTEPETNIPSNKTKEMPINWQMWGVFVALAASITTSVFTCKNINLTKKLFQISNIPNLAIWQMYPANYGVIADTDRRVSFTYHILDLRNRPIQIFYIREGFRFDVLPLDQLIR